ncbi:MAG: phage minor head protein [Sulfuricurvum sp.]|nr:phage minor head protein [Sulfuricurvum sp.]
MSLPKPSFAFGLKPKEAIDYLRSKGYKLSFDYSEMMHDAHHKAFTVAKVTRLDLLGDIHTSIADAMANGTRFEDWKKQIIPTLEKKGWWGRQEIVNPKTGEVKEAIIDGNRLRTILKTNTLVAHATARYEQQMRGNTEYWQYVGGLSEHPRMNHLAKNGTILPRTDPWWQTNYPPNAWGCQCQVRAWSRAQIERRGWNVSGSPGDNIATPDWSYNPGAGKRVGKLSKIDLDASMSSLPKLSDARRKEYADLGEDQLKKRFYSTLGIKPGDTYVDKVGDPMVVDDSLFTAGSGHSKLTKQDRHYFIDELAATVADPDEIYLEFDAKAKRLVKKMLRYFKGDKGSKRAIIVLFEYLPDKTQGVSAHVIDSSGGVEKKRMEKLIYQKGQE